MVCAQPRIHPGKWDNLLWDFEIQRAHLISARWLYLVIVDKRTCQIVDFAIPADHRVKLKEGEKKNKYLALARELKKNKTTWNVMMIPIVPTKCTNYSHQRIGTGAGRLGNKTMTGDYPNNNIVEIGQNIKESPGGLLSLSLQWKTIS